MSSGHPHPGAPAMTAAGKQKSAFAVLRDLLDQQSPAAENVSSTVSTSRNGARRAPSAATSHEDERSFCHVADPHQPAAGSQTATSTQFRRERAGGAPSKSRTSTSRKRDGKQESRGKDKDGRKRANPHGPS